MSKNTLPKSPIILKDDFLNPVALDWVLQEIKKQKGTFSREGYENRQTLRDKIDPRFCGTKFITNGRNILHSLWYKYFWPSTTTDMLETGDSSYLHSFFSRGYGDQILLSVYGDGDYYGKHVDIDMGCIITAVLMISFGNPKFYGGHLVVADQVIPFLPNRLVVFPSCYEHEVTKIENNSDEYTDQRFTLQYFVSAVPLKKPIIDESNNIQ